jgi:hypothetical protein
MLRSLRNRARLRYVAVSPNDQAAMQIRRASTKRTSRHVKPMSAFGGKADIGQPSLHRPRLP